MTYFSASLDPALTYYLLGYSTSAFNLSGLKSSQLDSLLNKFIFEADQSARKQVYPELVNAFAEQAPFIFLANQQQRYWTTPALHGERSPVTLSARERRSVAFLGVSVLLTALSYVMMPSDAPKVIAPVTATQSAEKRLDRLRQAVSLLPAREDALTS